LHRVALAHIDLLDLAAVGALDDLDAAGRDDLAGCAAHLVQLGPERPGDGQHDEGDDAEDHDRRFAEPAAAEGWRHSHELAPTTVVEPVAAGCCLVCGRLRRLSTSAVGPSMTILPLATSI